MLRLYLSSVYVRVLLTVNYLKVIFNYQPGSPSVYSQGMSAIRLTQMGSNTQGRLA